MTQQLKLSDGTAIPITLAQGQTQGGPIIGNRDYIDFTVSKDSTVSLDSLDALTAESAGNTDAMTLITDDTDSSGNPTHTEAPLSHYTYRTAFGKITTLVSPETGTAPAVYAEKVHIVLAQRTYSEVQAEQQATAIQAQSEAIAELSILVAGGGN